jgi:ribulose-phosphate 3-epimerase
MIEEPERYVADFARAGADIITVHVEACRHLHRNLQQIRGLPHHAGKRVLAGVSLNPHTPVDAVLHVLELCDLVLVMSVNPGFGGQGFIPQVRPKIRALRAAIAARGLATHVQVDGGITVDNIHEVAGDGADAFVSGSGVLRSKQFGRDYAAAISAMRAGPRPPSPGAPPDRPRIAALAWFRGGGGKTVRGALDERERGDHSAPFMAGASPRPLADAPADDPPARGDPRGVGPTPLLDPTSHRDGRCAPDRRIRGREAPPCKRRTATIADSNGDSFKEIPHTDKRDGADPYALEERQPSTSNDPGIKIDRG